MRNNWTREELILAFNLYFKIPYGQFNNRSKDVIALGNLIGRSAGAVAFKLVNFVSLDPFHKSQGRKGATNIGKLDKEIYQEFRDNWDELIFESEKILAQKQNKEVEELYPDILRDLSDKKGETRIREVKVRVNQDLFRKIVLTNYSNQCAITGIKIPELLIASHIKPWSKDEGQRLNPANGICLSATFDKAFDKGLITLNDNLEVLTSKYLKNFSNHSFYEKCFLPFEKKQIILPQKFMPDLDFIKYHNDVIFKK